MSRATVRFSVRLTPRGGTDRVDGVVDGVLRARVAAPAVDGAANQSLLRLLADELGVPRRDVRLVAGTAAGRRSSPWTVSLRSGCWSAGRASGADPHGTHRSR